MSMARRIGVDVLDGKRTYVFIDLLAI